MNKDILREIGLYFITDRKLSKKTVIDDAESAVRAGVRILQYREKELPTKEMAEEAERLREITRQKGALLIINDRIDVALAVDADGVHLGHDDMPYDKARKLLGKDKIVGLTAHSVDEALEAERIGADYIGVSPIFATTTKKDAGKPAGLRLLKEVGEKVRLPFVAIGGINYENLDSVLKAGAKMAAAISAIVAKDDVEAECKKFIEKMREFR